MDKKIGLHLGSAGKRIISENTECINIDINPLWQPDIVWDLEKGLPTPPNGFMLDRWIQDNSVDEVVAFHILEHLRNWVSLMKDIHKVCKNNALVHIKLPRAPTKFAFQDPQHVSFFTEDTFYYFDKWAWLYNYPIFKVLKVEDTKEGEEMIVELQVNK